MCEAITRAAPRSQAEQTPAVDTKSTGTPYPSSTSPHPSRSHDGHTSESTVELKNMSIRPAGGAWTPFVAWLFRKS